MLQYKYPEGSDQERRALYRGFRELEDAAHEVDFEVPDVAYTLGEKDVVFAVRIKNRSLTKHLHQINGCISCTAVTYTGKHLRQIGIERISNLSAHKGKIEVIQMHIKGNIFCEFPGTKVLLVFKTMLAVHGTNQVFGKDTVVTPTPPPMTITGAKRVIIGKESKVCICFRNPLDIQMDNVRLKIESDELLQGIVYKVKEAPISPYVATTLHYITFI